MSALWEGTKMLWAVRRPALRLLSQLLMLLMLGLSVIQHNGAMAALWGTFLILSRLDEMCDEMRGGKR